MDANGVGSRAADGVAAGGTAAEAALVTIAAAVVPVAHVGVVEVRDDEAGRVLGADAGRVAAKVRVEHGAAVGARRRVARLHLGVRALVHGQRQLARLDLGRHLGRWVVRKVGVASVHGGGEGQDGLGCEQQESNRAQDGGSNILHVERRKNVKSCRKLYVSAWVVGL
jgi:hypothetical protein